MPLGWSHTKVASKIGPHLPLHAHRRTGPSPSYSRYPSLSTRPQPSCPADRVCTLLTMYLPPRLSPEYGPLTLPLAPSSRASSPSPHALYTSIPPTPPSIPPPRKPPRRYPPPFTRAPPSPPHTYTSAHRPHAYVIPVSTLTDICTHAHPLPCRLTGRVLLYARHGWRVRGRALIGGRVRGGVRGGLDRGHAWGGV